MTGPARVPSAAASVTTLPFTNVTTTYTIDNTDCVINCTNNGSFTVTLPTAVGIEGQYFIIKNNGTGVIVIEGNGSETIDGLTSKTMAVRYESYTVISDGANWLVI
jgi:hypothetical protein